MILEDYPHLVFLDSGKWRDVYRHKRYVVKVPRNRKGERDNLTEAAHYAITGGQKGDFCYARCRLMRNGWLVMEYVEPVGASDMQSLPAWTKRIDHRQVGINRRGQLVAYDYANDTNKLI